MKSGIFRTVALNLMCIALLQVGSATAATFIRHDVDFASETDAPFGSHLPAPFGLPVGFGGIGGPVSFIAPFAGTLDIAVTDCCAGDASTVGDTYQVFLNGVSLGYTAIVDLYDPNLTGLTKHFSAHVDAGPNAYDIDDLVLNFIGDRWPFGFWPPSFNDIVDQDFLPASLFVDLSITPDPAPLPTALPMFVGGAGLITLLGRRRKRKQAAA